MSSRPACSTAKAKQRYPVFKKQKRKKYNILFYVYGCYACLYVCSSQVCPVPLETGRRHQIPWDLSYRLGLITIWLLAAKPRTFAIPASTPNY